MLDKEKSKKLESLFNSLKKKHGEESVKLLKNGDSFNKIPRWEIDSLFIADILGGGVPKGRLMEIYGPESSGKCLLGNTNTIIFVEEEFYKFLIDQRYLKNVREEEKKI